MGKRTTAVALAMAANCEGEGQPPCGACNSCRLVASGSHPDVMIIEPPEDRATPTISVEQVREVVRKVGYHRYSGKRRVVIVDPAEAMGPSAANALLKTLEEPPEGTASSSSPTRRALCCRRSCRAVSGCALPPCPPLTLPPGSCPARWATPRDWRASPTAHPAAPSPSPATDSRIDARFGTSCSR